MLRDEVDGHVGVEAGEIGLQFPKTRPFAEFVRLLGEEAFFVGHQHAGPEPFEGRETMVEAIGRRPGRITDVAPAAKMPFADMRGVIAGALQQPRDIGQLGVEPVGLTDRSIIGAVADIVDEADLGGKTPGQKARARGGTDRRRVIELRHQHAFARETVEVRGLDLLVPHRRQVAEAHVVDEHEQDIGLARCGRSGPVGSGSGRWRRDAHQRREHGGRGPVGHRGASCHRRFPCLIYPRTAALRSRRNPRPAASTPRGHR